MLAGSIQVGVGRFDRGEAGEAFHAATREFIEQGVERLLAPVADAVLPIEWRERFTTEYRAHARDPEIVLGLDEVGDDLARAPGAFAVVVVEPRSGKAGQLGTKDVRRPFQYRKCFV